MYQIKQKPSDFLVKEISSVEVKEQGSYLVFKLKKENYNTLDAVRIVAQKLGVLQKDVGFAGTKDKRAITEQLISVKINHHKKYLNKELVKEKLNQIELRNISLEFLGYTFQPITLGDLEGNSFDIVVRNLDNFDFETPTKITNYFGEQRFGGNNIEVGRNIIKKNFKKACELINESKINEHLVRKENDYVGAIRLIPKRLLRLYVNAYQSYLWNEIVTEVVNKKIEVDEVPLIGFGTDFPDLNEELMGIVESLLEKEELELTDFIIKQIPNLSLEGNSRKVWVEVKDFKVIEKGDDELNQNKKKIKISFQLQKGSYATVVLKELF